MAETVPTGAGTGAAGAMNGPRMLGEAVGIAVHGLRANLVRSGLTIMGVAVGVAVVVIVAAFITGIRTSVMSAFEAAGPANFTVTRFDFSAVRQADDGSGRPPWWDHPEIEPYEAERVARLPTIREAIFRFGFGATVDFEGRRVEGVGGRAYSSGWPAYMPGTFVAGRDFIPAEVRRSRTSAVLSSDLATELFGGRDPIGRRVGLTNLSSGTRRPFEVIGVFDPDDNIFSGSETHWVIVPHTAARKHLGASDAQAQILVMPREDVAQSVAMNDVLGLMRGLRGLGPREESGFGFLRSDQLVEMFDRMTGIFFLVMLALSSAGLLVGGVGVIGIMLISVTERTREIGIRKAVGATRRDILGQFLVEAVALTVLGSALGLAIGAAASGAVEAYTPIPAEIPVWSVVAALVMASVAGIAFGLLPAYRAARLDPTDALRYE